MEKRKDFSDLKREVIDAGTCTLCGGCVATCRLLDLGFLSMDVSEGRPMKGEEAQQLSGTCGSCFSPISRPELRAGLQCAIDCGYCYYQCPQVEKPVAREGLDEWYEVRSKDEELRKACNNGGAALALLASALADAVVEGCIMVNSGGPMPEVRVAMSKAQLIENAAGTYGSAPVLTGIADAILKYGLWSAALVGTPCQMEAYEQMLAVGRGTHNAHDFSSNVRLRIGIFCQGVYSTGALLKEYLERERGIPLDQVTELAIKDDGLHVYAGDQELLHASLEEIEAYKRPCCKLCEDFIGRFADISVGHIGSPAGASTVIIHTDFGKEVFERAVEWGFIDAKPLDRSGVELIKQRQQEKQAAGKAEQKLREQAAR
jgi:coenzyme F420 hydrogenase subunit beta